MATATSLQRLARRALLSRAKGDAALTVLIPAASIAPDGEPAWPFMLIEAPTTLRLRAACVRGARVSFDVHAFARGDETQTGYDAASAAGSQIETTFADNRLTLENGAVCHIEFSDIRLLRDEAPNDWHWFGQLNCRVLAAPA